ncbi:MAG: hypothetical protein ACO3A2_02760 [Bdellovibrionia bacterium]
MSTRVRSTYQPRFSQIIDPTDQIRDLIQSQVRGTALALIQGLFMEEVETLCGKVFSRKGSAGYHRGGSDPGSVCLQGRRIAVKKHRVKSTSSHRPTLTDLIRPSL